VKREPISFKSHPDSTRYGRTTEYARTLPVPEYRVVQIDGKDFYLGEQEQLAIPLPFWSMNYKDIVSILPTSSFSAFAEAVELSEMFETKFSDMKSSFGGTVGDPKQMATACYRDLIQIAERLKQSKGLRPRY
jgi:hypothetical protein